MDQFRDSDKILKQKCLTQIKFFAEKNSHVKIPLKKYYTLFS